MNYVNVAETIALQPKGSECTAHDIRVLVHGVEHVATSILERTVPCHLPGDPYERKLVPARDVYARPEDLTFHVRTEPHRARYNRIHTAMNAGQKRPDLKAQFRQARLDRALALDLPGITAESNDEDVRAALHRHELDREVTKRAEARRVRAAEREQKRIAAAAARPAAPEEEPRAPASCRKCGARAGSKGTRIDPATGECTRHRPRPRPGVAKPYVPPVHDESASIRPPAQQARHPLDPKAFAGRKHTPQARALISARAMRRRGASEQEIENRTQEILAGERGSYGRAAKPDGCLKGCQPKYGRHELACPNLDVNALLESRAHAEDRTHRLDGPVVETEKPTEGKSSATPAVIHNYPPVPAFTHGHVALIERLEAESEQQQRELTLWRFALVAAVGEIRAREIRLEIERALASAGAPGQSTPTSHVSGAPAGA